MRYRGLTGIDYDCEDCIHNDKEWDELPCDTCCHAHSGYEPTIVEAEGDNIEESTYDRGYNK